MSYPNDPIRSWWKRRVIVLSAGAVLLGMTCVWAAWPVIRTHPKTDATAELAVASSPTIEKTLAQAQLDAAAFDKVLWTAPPDGIEASASKGEPPPRAPNLELIAIIREDGAFRAALYEVQSDRLHVLGAGERIGRLEIVLVSSTGVDLRDGSRTYRLALTPPPAPSSSRLSLLPQEEDPR